MTPTQRNDLRAKAMTASPGPWVPKRLNQFGSGEHPFVQGPTMAIKKRLYGSGMTIGFKSQHDAIYIASASPEVVLALLDQLQEYEEALKRIAPLNSEGPYQAILAPGIAQQALAKYQEHGN